MGIDDKFKNEAEDFGGKAKENIGDLTGDNELKAEGKADQASAGLKKVGEKLKDAGNEVVNKVKDLGDSSAADSVKDGVSKATDKVKDLFNKNN